MSRLEPYLNDYFLEQRRQSKLKNNRKKYKNDYKKYLQNLLKIADNADPIKNKVRTDYQYFYDTMWEPHPKFYYVQKNPNWNITSQQVIINLIIEIIEEEQFEEQFEEQHPNKKQKVEEIDD